MISLAILRSLLSECKRDVGLFATSVVNILERALGLASKPVAGGGLDLDIAIRAVGVVSNISYPHLLSCPRTDTDVRDVHSASLVVHLVRDLCRWCSVRSGRLDAHLLLGCLEEIGGSRSTARFGQRARHERKGCQGFRD